ncbi:hypothetical protein WN944_017669 [Citrus x changshan-huyou]|uniref:Myeloid leukemia factor 1 n=1 Tax=Citrus x changshan-huyou TaxID=2935761 RepID=A0AAP0QLD9_9ROSI
MQRGREDRNDLFGTGDPFSIFRGFGSLRSMMPTPFGGGAPFDDLFFTRPFGSKEPITPNNNEKGLVIEELNSDHEGEMEELNSGDREMHSGSSKEPSVEHPDDDVEEGKNDDVNYKTHQSKVQGTQPQARGFSFQTCKVTYGGVDGAYYTSSRTRRTGNDGVVLEESKEADRTTGQATHRISRGINDKGHSFTKKLNSDGKVDTLQTLHNLNEDELAGFEEAWKGNANKHYWSEGFDMNRNAGSSQDEQKGRSAYGGWALPSSEKTRNAGVTTSYNEAMASASGGRAKKVVRINIE